MATQQSPDAGRVKPLKRRTMTLDQLQRRTVKVLRQVAKQFKRNHYEDGMTDSEFVEEVINALANDIMTDRVVLKFQDDKKWSCDVAKKPRTTRVIMAPLDVSFQRQDIEQSGLRFEEGTAGEQLGVHRQISGWQASKG